MEPISEAKALELAQAWNVEHGGDGKFTVTVHLDERTACWWIIQVDADGRPPIGSRPCVTPQEEVIAFSSNQRTHNFEIVEEVLAEAFVSGTLDPLNIREVARDRTKTFRGR